jgi:hypothetical protein
MEKVLIQYVSTGKIHIIVVRQECDISVSHLYKWALRVAERCVFSAAPGQPERGKETS